MFVMVEGVSSGPDVFVRSFERESGRFRIWANALQRLLVFGEKGQSCSRTMSMRHRSVPGRQMPLCCYGFTDAQRVSRGCGTDTAVALDPTTLPRKNDDLCALEGLTDLLHDVSLGES
jgi:hypothetical protein